MIEYTLINFFIFLSVLVCVGACLISACFIYRRNRNSKVHLFFALFFIGLGGFVLFYLFLQDPLLKEISYPLQLLNISISILGLCMFYYSLANEGQISSKLLISCVITLFLIPILSIILHPYSFITQDYGYELIIDPWFMIFVNLLYLAFICPTIIGLIRTYLKTENKNLKQKLIQTFLALLLIVVAGLIFFSIIPAFLNIHYLKPIGYGIISFAVIIMALAFKGAITKNEE